MGAYPCLYDGRGGEGVDALSLGTRPLHSLAQKRA